MEIGIDGGIRCTDLLKLVNLSIVSNYVLCSHCQFGDGMHMLLNICKIMRGNGVHKIYFNTVASSVVLFFLIIQVLK